MEGSAQRYDALLRAGARRLTGFQRRSVLAEVAMELCEGRARKAERRFGWGCETVEKGLHEGVPIAVRRGKARIFSGCDSRPATGRSSR